MTERDPDVERVPGTESIYRVDGRLFGEPGQLAVYVLDTPKPALVDTGTADTTPDAVLAALEKLDIERDELAHLIPTHVHLDHAGGTGELAAACPNATVHCHERGIDFLTDPALLEKLKASVEDAIGMPEPYGDPEVVPADRTRSIAGGDAIDLGDRTLEVVDAPGHAPHQACLFDETTDVLFAADAAGMLFDGEIRPTTQPPSFDLEDAVETVRELRSLEPAVNCYPHFGVATDAPTRLETYETMLPEWVDAVEHAAETTDDPGAIADQLRPEWKGMGLEGDVAGVLQYLRKS
ncbi:MBL fold metallo-hydrolase [Natronolimnohabitans innermongolicus]|uniref:Zn-dependent hydrolase, glyoxylase n=1 Tax=Natronolimnohabitans innermongolicus JCM 12255 TaxID=1227499 RepID=L9WTH6_9EURY|nr:MBL fold metallo-hydrolase [Natronolimnohabitans innermongolicus]ELY52496.1 zn-dependent hydrolase, glyoxylase [Natronolimnohabitans innermongolicus JCM 12255]